MRVVVAMVAVVVLAVAVVGEKKYFPCSQRDFLMMVHEVCTTRPHHRAPPANNGIMTIRVPSLEAQRERRRQDEDQPYQAPPLWDILYNRRISDEELPMMDGAPDLLSAPVWQILDSESYDEPPSQPGGRSERPDYPLSKYARENHDDDAESPHQRETGQELRRKCCLQGCVASELYGFCV